MDLKFLSPVASAGLIAAGLVVIGCGGPDAAKTTEKKTEVKDVKVTPENQASLFPFTEGNSWVFNVDIQRQAAGKQSQTGSGQIEYRVVKVTKGSDGETRATLEVSQDGGKKDLQEWATDSKGIYQTSMKTEKIQFSPKQPVIRFPVKDQDEFNWQGTGLTPIGKSGKMSYGYKNDGMQVADTDMGSMSCVYIQSAGKFETGLSPLILGFRRELVWCDIAKPSN
jgi:hypothetical protein